MIWKCFSHIIDCLFIPVGYFVSCAETFQFDVVPFVYLGERRANWVNGVKCTVMEGNLSLGSEHAIEYSDIEL